MKVSAVCLNPEHGFHKYPRARIRLLAGLGVEGDAHCGSTVKHRSRVRQNPNQPNLRQVHLIHSELHNALQQQGFTVKPGDMGENITTTGIELLHLPRHTRLHIGESMIEITGLRNPCQQLNDFQPGLMQAVLEKDAAGNLIRKAGVMGIVIQGGIVAPGDDIQVVLPPLPHLNLERV